MRVDVQQITTGVMGHLPESFDPRWLQHAWSGEHGSLGMHASMHTIESSARVRPDALTATAKVIGDVQLDAARSAGELKRGIRLAEGGRLVADHTRLELKEWAQGKGYASSLNSDSYDRYRAVGIEDVELTAGLDAGGLVWARSGFELRPPAGLTDPTEQELITTRAHEIRRLMWDAHYEGRISRYELEQLDDRILRHDQRVGPRTLTSIAQVAELPEGRRALRGAKWDGIRHLQTPHPWGSRPSPTGTSAYQDARIAIAELLPDAVAPDRLTRALEDATAGLPTRLRARSGHDAPTATINLVDPMVRTSAPFDITAASGRTVGSYDLQVNGFRHATTALATSVDVDDQVAHSLHERVRQVLADTGVETLSQRERHMHVISQPRIHTLA